MISIKDDLQPFDDKQLVNCNLRNETKTIIGTALLAGTCALPASAQIGEQRHNFSVGINGGINLNSVSFSPRVRQNNLMGINGGLTARYISENTSV